MMKRLINIALILVFLSFFPVQENLGQASSSDSIIIEGLLLSTDKLPIGNVSVSLETGNSVPVISDSTGKFLITSPSLQEWLIINPINHSNKRVFINGKQKLTIYLSDKDIVSGNDDINLSFEREKSRNIISSYKNLRIEEDIHLKQVGTLGDYFQGSVAGILSTSLSGMPGAGSNLMLRGVRSIYTNTQPLYIIDGMPIENQGVFNSHIEGNDYNPLSSLNPNDISNITILKDAASTAIYGVNGSNGVVLINTLNPSATLTTIDLTVRTGISLKPKYIPQLNSRQFKTLSNEILASSNMYEEEYESIYPGLFLLKGELGYLPYSHETNWQDEIYTLGTSKDVNLSVKGGDEISRYGLAVDYMNHDGVIKNTNFTRYNIRFVSFLKVYSWLEMKINANLNNYSSSLQPSALSREASPILTSLIKSPLLFPYNYDDNGKLLQTIADVKEFNVSNPLAIIENSKSINTNNRFISSVNLEAKINQYLRWSSMIGINFNNLKEEIFRPDNGMADYLEGLAYSLAEGNTNQLFSVYSQHYLSYNKRISPIHSFSSNAGFRIHTNTFENDWGLAKNLPENDEFSELQSGDNGLREMGGYSEKWNKASSFFTANYMLLDRYSLLSTFSFDFSSRNGDEAAGLLKMGQMPIGFFYSAGAGWRLSNEAFLSDYSWLENLFLRVSYGKSGNDDIGNINALDYYKQVRFRESSALIPGNIPNTSLKHEDSYQSTIGLDISLLSNRYFATIEYFRNKTKDLFFYQPQAAYIGYESRPTNGGEILNTGIELSAFARLINTHSFKWDIHGNLSFLNNEVLSIIDDQLTTSFTGGEYISKLGEEVNSFYGYQFEGVYSDQQEAGYLLNDKQMEFGAGDAIFRDFSGPDDIPDGIINDYDKIVLGSPIPDYFGSLTNSFHYKRFSLNATFYFVVGNEVFNYLRYQNEKMDDLSNQSVNTLQRWQQNGDETDVPRALWKDPIGNSDFSSRWIEDGSFLKLSNLSISYHLDDKVLMFRNSEFFISAKNLMTWSDYLGYDPELSHSFNTMEQGIDYGKAPVNKQFMIGIKIGL
ncbi:MAG: SusC/RagA family TonB-linked outer membrane protein [Bacteroidales bacterium]|nr:SusC/RagA family TonB-linked outer membrane protein [Bacteroidales bacterium]